MTQGAEDAFEGGAMWRKMLRIAAPLSLASVIRAGVELANAHWIGELGLRALSIMTSLGTFVTLSAMFGGLTSAGTAAVVGRLSGERRGVDAARVSQKVVAVSLVLGAIVALVALATSSWALAALGHQGPTRLAARAYLSIITAGLPTSFGLMAVHGVLVGLGRPNASVRISFASLAVALVITPFLTRVVHAGVVSASLAHVTGEATGFVLGLRALAAIAKERGAVVPFRERLSNLREVWPVLRIGGPLTLDAAIHGAVAFGLVAYLSRFGPSFLAAQGAEERLGQLLNVGTDGLAPATATLVAFELGAGRRRNARRVVMIGLGAVALQATLAALVMRGAPAWALRFLCDDADFLTVGARVLAVATIGVAFVGARDLLEAAFGGAGNTLPPVLVGLGVALTRIPLAVYLAVHLHKGGLGVTWAVNLTLALQVLILLVWFVTRARRSGPRPGPFASAHPPPMASETPASASAHPPPMATDAAASAAHA